MLRLQLNLALSESALKVKLTPIILFSNLIILVSDVLLHVAGILILGVFVFYESSLESCLQMGNLKTATPYRDQPKPEGSQASGAGVEVGAYKKTTLNSAVIQQHCGSLCESINVF